MTSTANLTPAQQKVIKWLCHGEVGSSSHCMAMWLAFGEVGDVSHPYDPDDLDRCLKLLDDAPELRGVLTSMGKLSPHWDALISRWDAIEKSHLDEVGLGWTKARRAPLTYDLMRSALDSVKAGNGH
jgi:hypothetical protein